MNSDKYLAFSGGSANGIVYVGVYKALYERNIIQSLSGAVGCSIGSFFALMCCLGIKPDTLYNDIMALDVKKLADDSWCPIIDFEDLVHKLGLCKGKFLLNWVEHVLERETGIKNITFAQLFKLTGKHLKTVTFNETKVRIEYWDHITQPDMKVSSAIRASTSLPVIFEPFRMNGDIFVDGGCGDVFPLESFPDALGIMVMSAEDEDVNDLVTHVEVKSLQDHLLALYIGMSTILFRLKNKDWVSRTLAVKGPNKSTWDFTLTQEEKKTFIDKAYKDTLISVLPLHYNI